MLSALSISNFVLIDRLDLEAGSGFTGLTGETGAGKSIILDALGCALGMRPEKRFVRAGAGQAVVIAAFDPAPGHAVWQALEEAGLDRPDDDALMLRRVIPARGAARSFVNDRPVSSGLLAHIGSFVAEIYGQHAASNLLKPSCHRDLLDAFAGNEALLAAYGEAWGELKAARSAYRSLAETREEAIQARDELQHMVGELEAIAPVPGEETRLATERAQRMQAGRIAEAVSTALASLERADADTLLAGLAASLARLGELPGFETGEEDGPLSGAFRSAAGGLERASIETREAVDGLQRLAQIAAADDNALEALEARLFALRALARKYRAAPDDLPAKLEAARAALDLAEADEAELDAAKARERGAAACWHGAAAALRRAREAAARRMQRAVQTELEPLKLGAARIRIAVTALPDAEADARGADRVEIEVETNPGSGFGPLRRIASGGELARFSLALKCAAAEAGGAMPTLIFDEADHGVGGAVAAAIGERLLRLSEDRQVFAVTHSPQVAAAANTGWRIEKARGRKSGKAVGQTRARVLDAKSRLEEIARMLSGAKVTPEARAAAERLLEG